MGQQNLGFPIKIRTILRKKKQVRSRDLEPNIILVQENQEIVNLIFQMQKLKNLITIGTKKKETQRMKTRAHIQLEWTLSRQNSSLNPNLLCNLQLEIIMLPFRSKPKSRTKRSHLKRNGEQQTTSSDLKSDVYNTSTAIKFNFV